MSLSFKKPSKMLIVSDPLSDLNDTYKVMRDFKSGGVQPGIYVQHGPGLYKEVFATSEDDLIESLEDKSVFISSARNAEDVSSGSTLGVVYDKLQEYGLTLCLGEDDQFGRILLAYDPELPHLHASEQDELLQ